MCGGVLGSIYSTTNQSLMHCFPYESGSCRLKKRNPITLSSTEQSYSSLHMFSLGTLYVVCSDLLLLEMMGHSAEAVGSRVTLPSRDKFSIIDKNKEVSVRRKTTDITSNIFLFSLFVNQSSFILTDGSLHINIGPFPTLGSNEWPALCPWMCCKHNIGKYTFVRAVMYYSVLKLYSLLT